MDQRDVQERQLKVMTLSIPDQIDKRYLSLKYIILAKFDGKRVDTVLLGRYKRKCWIEDRIYVLPISWFTNQTSLTASEYAFQATEPDKDKFEAIKEAFEAGEANMLLRQQEE